MYSGVEVNLAVFGSYSPAPMVWPDGDQSRKPENTVRKYLYLPSNRQAPDQCEEFNGFSEEGLRDLGRSLVGKIEVVKRKMDQGQAKKQAMKRSRLGFGCSEGGESGQRRPMLPAPVTWIILALPRLCWAA